MNPSAKGKQVAQVTRWVEDDHLAAVAEAIGTASAKQTATLVTWFGPTVEGEQQLLDVLQLDLSRALLAGQSYEWVRPLEGGETVAISVVIEDVFEKGDNTFGIVKTEIRDENGQIVQQQRTTFIERGAK